MELVYYGWSCFTLVTARGRLVFDPNWTNPFGRPHTGPASFADAELCLVTHGAFDHIRDVPALMKSSHMALVGSTTFEWEHRIIDTAKMFAARPEAKAILSGLYFANPYDARRMGFTILLEDGRRLTYYCESFNDQTRFDRVRAVAERDRRTSWWRGPSSTTRGRSRRRPSFALAGPCSSTHTRITSTSSGFVRTRPPISSRRFGAPRRRWRSRPSSQGAASRPELLVG